MFYTEGIETTTNEAGEITHLKIDVQKQQEIAVPILEKLEAERKAAFRKEWEQAIDVEDARKRSLKRMNDRWERLK